MQLLRQNIYHILLFIHILCSVQGKHNEPQWKWTLITERRNWHTITNMSRERENEKWPLHGEASTTTCLSLDKQSPGHVPCCYLRASALIRNPFAFHAQTEQRKRVKWGVHHYSGERSNQNPPLPPKYCSPAPRLGKTLQRSFVE